MDKVRFQAKYVTPADIVDNEKHCCIYFYQRMWVGMKVNRPKNINMLLHLLTWFDTCHGQRCDTKKEKKREPQLDSNSQTQLEVSLLQVVVFKVQTQTARKFWLSHAPQIVCSTNACYDPYRIIIHQRLTPNPLLRETC